MSDSERSAHVRIRPWLVIGLWVLYAVISINQSILWNEISGRTRPWYSPVAFALTISITWGLFTPLIIYAARRFPLGRTGWQRNLLVHIPLSLTLSLLDLFVDRWSGHVFEYGGNMRFWADYLYQLDMNTFYYAVITVSVTAADFSHMLRERQVRATELQTELVRSRLEVLKMQLQPHFLFNTLHSINALIHDDPEAADQMVTRLADLLRLSLHEGGHEVALASELELVRTYVEIERVRFGQRLCVELQVDDDVLDARVPTLLLQPLVENAIRHGIAPRGKGGRITISAQRAGESLRIEIADDGVGLAKTATNGRRTGIGLANTRARLQQLYDDEQQLSIGPRAGGGTLVAITIPYAEMGEPAESMVALI